MSQKNSLTVERPVVYSVSPPSEDGWGHMTDVSNFRDASRNSQQGMVYRMAGNEMEAEKYNTQLYEKAIQTLGNIVTIGTVKARFIPYGLTVHKGFMQADSVSIDYFYGLLLEEQNSGLGMIWGEGFMDKKVFKTVLYGFVENPFLVGRNNGPGLMASKDSLSYDTIKLGGMPFIYLLGIPQVRYR